MMWRNGGPGCSSVAGLLFELGPCNIVDDGNSTAYSNYSWNQHANMIFLDEPIGTGFSYASDGSTVDTLTDLAVDVHAFLQLFLTRFSQYASAPFHLAAESWRGHYGPNIAHLIHQKNKELDYAPRSGMKKINLSSPILANGLTDPAIQFVSIPDYPCGGGAPYPPLKPNSAACAAPRLEEPICTRLIQMCHKFTSKLTCDPATAYCWMGLLAPMALDGQNIYDLRIQCDTSAKICYPELDWVVRWMNDPSNKKELGVGDFPGDFETCNMKINESFYAQGQAMHTSAALLPELINDGVRLLAYAGNTDGVCNYMVCALQ